MRPRGTLRPPSGPLSVLRALPALPVLILLWGCGSGGADPEPPFDLVIANGRVVDGTGNPWFRADVGIRGDRIAEIGDLAGAPSARRIDAEGRIVAPGFIDPMGWTDWQLLVDPRAASKVTQGITTTISGEGSSVAPLDSAIRASRRTRFGALGADFAWTSLADFLRRLEATPPTINYGALLGAGQLREMVVGREDRAAEPEELEAMERMVEEGMRDGALGISTSLMYVPHRFADTGELVALASVAQRFGGVYATHQRSETDAIHASLDEIFEIAEEARIPVHVFHLKVAGRQNWGRMDRVVARIDSAREAGLQVTADVYPYTFASAELSALLPPWAREGSTEAMLARLDDPEARARIRAELEEPTASWENEYYGAGGAEGFVLTHALVDSLRPLEGKGLAEVAAAREQDPRDVLMDLVRAGSMEFISFIMDEEDVARVIAEPWVAFCTDSGAEATDGPLAGRGLPHPRAYGAFPRVFARYVREAGTLSLEEAVRRASWLPARIFGVRDRGLLREGMMADVVVFDPDRIQDLSTHLDPHRYSEGPEWVVVNGRVVVDEGRITEERPGRALRGPGWTADTRP